MKVYLAASYQARDTIIKYSLRLKDNGYEITSRWLNADKDKYSNKSLCTEILMRTWAKEDVEDIIKSDMVICFTEVTTPSGGMHVEFGIGLALGKRMVVIGQRTNVFHRLTRVEYYKTLEDFLQVV